MAELPPNPDHRSALRSAMRVLREMAEMVERIVGPDAPTEPEPFVPNEFQRQILEALDGKALRTDALAGAVGNRRRLFKHPGGISELIEEGLVANHPRCGYYRPDRAPPEIFQDVSP